MKPIKSEGEGNSAQMDGKRIGYVRLRDAFCNQSRDFAHILLSFANTSLSFNACMVEDVLCVVCSVIYLMLLGIVKIAFNALCEHINGNI
mmetsp:Transcript_17308/g.43190  ORF Transcript_17308/g.43190 Transcript_17308/m.43190 type:complete len:90 (+) Transcript_17308:233-502(+)